MARKSHNNCNPYEVEWPDEALALCIHLYDEQPLPVDKLPYTGAFNDLWFRLNARCRRRFSKHHTFQQLMKLRKRSQPPKVETKTKLDEITGKELAIPTPTWWE